MSIIDSNKKFTHQEKKLIENFITKAKKESPINDLTFEYNLHVPESVYKLSYDIPRGNLAAEKLSDGEKEKINEKTFRDCGSGFVEILSYRLWEN